GLAGDNPGKRRIVPVSWFFAPRVAGTGTMGVLLWRVIRVAGRPPVWLGMALAFDAAIAVTAITAGRDLNLADLLGAAPLLASARCNGRVTAAAAAYALALCVAVTMIGKSLG